MNESITSGVRTTMKLRIATCILIGVLVWTCGGAQAQLRFQNSLSLSAGAYAASGFGTNHYLGLRYNYHFLGGRYFVEGAFGVGSLRSRVLESVSRSQLFESHRLSTYEFVAAVDAQPSGYLPYVAAGVAGVNQGGQSKFAGVVGIGKRIPLAPQFGLRYDIRDQIFSQSVNGGESFVTHNIVLALGFQVFF